MPRIPGRSATGPRRRGFSPDSTRRPPVRRAQRDGPVVGPVHEQSVAQRHAAEPHLCRGLLRPRSVAGEGVQVVVVRHTGQCYVSASANMAAAATSRM